MSEIKIGYSEKINDDTIIKALKKNKKSCNNNFDNCNNNSTCSRRSYDRKW